MKKVYTKYDYINIYSSYLSDHSSNQKTVMGRDYPARCPCFCNTVFECSDALAYDFIL